jgi:outer membrane protein assembly factor BamB
LSRTSAAIPAWRIALICAAALTCLAADREKPAPWPTFRGNAAQTGVAACPLSDRLKLLWTCEAGAPVESTAAIQDGVAYLGTMKGELLAIDLATGKVKWRYKAQGAIEAAPGIRDGKLFFGTSQGVFHAVSAATGEKLWTFEAAGQIVGSANFIGANVLFGSYDHFLYCLAQDTGKVVWKFQTDAELHASPCVADGAVVIGGCDAQLRVIDAAAGTQRGILQLSFNVASSPAFDGKRIFDSTYDNHMYCADPSGVLRPGESHELRKVWDVKVAEDMHFRASPALSGDRVIFAGQDGIVRCMAKADGRELWKFMARGEIDSSPVIAGDRVFFGSNDGTLYALEVADGAKVWSFAAGAEIEASPAVGEERLVIGARDGAVYCFGPAGGAG